MTVQISTFFCVLFLAQLALAETPSTPLKACEKNASTRPIYGAQCGVVSVHENPNDADSRILNISILRIPAIRDSQKPPIFFIAGGPGQASTQLATRIRYQFSELLVDHDFVFVDQRGTGKSHPLECDVDLMRYLDIPPKDAEAIVLEEIEKCVNSYEVDLTYYSTPYAVMDLELVREKLGYSKIFLLGVSYGTRVILEYLRSHSDALAGAVLDGVAPITLQNPVFAAEDSSAALNKIFEFCAQDAACQNSYPTLKADWIVLINQLDNTPKNISLKHPRTEKIYDVYIDKYVLSGWVRMILYLRDAMPLLPLAINRASQGDFSTLFSIASLGFEKLPENISEGLQAAVLCMEDHRYSQVFSSSPEPISALMHIAGIESFSDTCALFPKGDLDREYFEPFETAVPSLLLSGSFDPATPPKWATSIESHFENAKHIVVPGGHHNVFGLGCIPRLITDFFNEPNQLSVLDASCTEKIKPLPIFIDNAGPMFSTSTSKDTP